MAARLAHLASSGRPSPRDKPLDFGELVEAKKHVNGTPRQWPKCHCAELRP